MKLDDIAPQPCLNVSSLKPGGAMVDAHQKVEPQANQWMPHEMECTTGLGDRMTPAAPP